jgi:hypothetical protein
VIVQVAKDANKRWLGVVIEPIEGGNDSNNEGPREHVVDDSEASVGNMRVAEGNDNVDWEGHVPGWRDKHQTLIQIHAQEASLQAWGKIKKISTGNTCMEIRCI